MNEDTRPTHLDLFSGIGGFSLAFESVGFRTIGFSEIDPYASAVLKKHWPTVPNYGDVRTVPAVRCDVITGGFPCQPWSEAGLQRGESDHRNLWPAMRDVIQRCRPSFVVGENVSAFIDLGLEMVLVDLENLGYSAQPFSVPACAVRLAQIEGERCWIVAAADGIGFDPMQKAGVLAGSTCREPTAKEIGGGIGCFRGVSGRVYEAPVTAFDRVDYGLPGELDRVRCLGNSIPPAVAQIFAQAIYQQLRP